MNHDTPLTDAPAALVGIDWAEQEHAVCLREAGAKGGEASVLKHTPKTIDEWAAGLRKRFGGRPVAICLEQSKGALIYALLKYGFFILYPSNPAKLANYRKALTHSGAKDDPTDAELLLNYLAHYGDRMPAWKPDDEATRLIRILVERRRQAIALRTQCSNRLRAVWKCYFPQALELVGEELGTTIACDFLARWPTLAKRKRARTETVREFYHAHHCRGQQRIDRRLASIRQTTPLTNDMAIIEAGIREVQMLVGLLRQLMQPVADYDRRIEQLMDAHDDAPIFRSLPGAGAAMARLAFDRTGAPCAPPLHRRAGNMTSLPRPSSPATGLARTWDAWNRVTGCWKRQSLGGGRVCRTTGGTPCLLMGCCRRSTAWLQAASETNLPPREH